MLESRQARHAAERYLAAVGAGDSAAVRAGSTCPAPGPSFRGGTVLRVESPESMTLRALDSLATASRVAARRAEVELALAGEETADSLWRRADDLERRAKLWGFASRAAMRSRARSGRVTLRRVRVRIRWGGPLVGPERVDREHVLRVLAAPGGPWIVYGLLPRDGDPGPLPAGPASELTEAQVGATVDGSRDSESTSFEVTRRP